MHHPLKIYMGDVKDVRVVPDTCNCSVQESGVRSLTASHQRRKNWEI